MQLFLLKSKAEVDPGRPGVFLMPGRSPGTSFKNSDVKHTVA
jgi:hypothetical protein